MNSNLINKKLMLFIGAPILIPINLFALLWGSILIYSGYVNYQSINNDNSDKTLGKKYIIQGSLILIILVLCNYYIIQK